MKIATSKKLPSAAELVDVLERKFGKNYSYQLFGLGKNKTVLVGESTFVGVQISIDDNGFTTQGSVTSSPLAYFGSFLAITGFAFFIYAFLGFSHASKMKAMEKEIAIFLKTTYN